MSLRFLQHIVVRSWLVFVIVRFSIILAHRMIFELVPHQNPAQIGMAVEPDSVQIENLTLLKFCTPPGRRERGQASILCTVCGLHSNDDRSVFVRHRVEVINSFKEAGNFFLGRFNDLFLFSIDDFFYLHRFL